MHTKNVLPDRWIVVVRLFHGPGLGKISVCSFVINSIALKCLARATSFLFLLGFGSYICYKAYHCLNNLSVKPNADDDDDISCIDDSHSGWHCYITPPDVMVKCHSSLASALDHSLNFGVSCQSPYSVIQRSQFPEIYASYVSSSRADDNTVFGQFFEDNILWPYSDDSSEDEIYVNSDSWQNVAENELDELSYSSLLSRDSSADSIKSFQGSIASPSHCKSFSLNEEADSAANTECAVNKSNESNVVLDQDVNCHSRLRLFPLFSDNELEEIKQLFPGDSSISFFDKVCKEISVAYKIPEFKAADIHKKLGFITASELCDIEDNVHRLKEDISGIVSDLVNLKLCCCAKELSWRLFYTSDNELSDISQSETMSSTLLDVVQQHRTKVWLKGFVQSPVAGRNQTQPDVLPEFTKVCSIPASSKMSCSSSLTSLNDSNHWTKLPHMRRSFSFQSNHDLDQKSKTSRKNKRIVQSLSPNHSLNSSISLSRSHIFTSSIKQSHSSQSLTTSLKHKATRLPRTASSPEGGLLTNQIICAIKSNRPSVPSMQRSITLPSFDPCPQVNSLSVSSGLHVSQESFEANSESDYMRTFLSSSTSFESNFDYAQGSELSLECHDRNIYNTVSNSNAACDWDSNGNVYQRDEDEVNANVEHSLQTTQNSIYSESVSELQNTEQFISERPVTNLCHYEQISMS